MLILLSLGGSLHFADIAAIKGSEPLLALAAVLIFMGAMGKSAQFPVACLAAGRYGGPDGSVSG